MKTETGKIEDMPLGAKLTGIVYRLDPVSGDEPFVLKPEEKFVVTGVRRDFSLKPTQIEVHEDVIILLCGRFYSRNKAPKLEVSIIRGTHVEWEI